MAALQAGTDVITGSGEMPVGGRIHMARSLVRKLAEVMQEVGHVEKKGYNSHFKYKFVRESDLVDSVREALASRNVIVLSDCIDERLEGDLTRLRVALRFIDGDSGEELVTHVVADGQDKQDKGPYKALTGAVKYGLMKTFLIGTGDDPENHDARDDRANGPDPARRVKQAAASEQDELAAAIKNAAGVLGVPAEPILESNKSAMSRRAVLKNMQEAIQAQGAED